MGVFIGRTRLVTFDDVEMTTEHRAATYQYGRGKGSLLLCLKLERHADQAFSAISAAT